MKEVTIVITPRDRYSGAVHCIQNLYKCTDVPFTLIVLDLGYPKPIAQAIEAELKLHEDAHFVRLGKIIPVEAFRKIRTNIKTPFTVLLDNDSDVTKGWLPPLLETGRQKDAAIISPLILERKGVDVGAELRNHFCASEIRVVKVNNEDQLIEHKLFRRELPENLPKEVQETHLFELHCVMFNTEVLKKLELPQMVIREHIDIGMQVQAMGKKLLVNPASIVHFDNLGERASWPDFEFFTRRWNPKVTKASSDLFAKRWGYRFYSEQFMYNWCFRRKIFMFARLFYLPIGLSNKIAGLFTKIFCRNKDPLKDPIGQSKVLYQELPRRVPVQLDHSVN